MKKLYKSNKAGKLTAYSAMAGAFVAVGTDANALVVYNDIDLYKNDIWLFLNVKKLLHSLYN